LSGYHSQSTRRATGIPSAIQWNGIVVAGVIGADIFSELSNTNDNARPKAGRQDGPDTKKGPGRGAMIVLGDLLLCHPPFILISNASHTMGNRIVDMNDPFGLFVTCSVIEQGLGVESGWEV
jgi:hypothetical protein